MAENKTSKIYPAVHKVLSDLSVAKNGTLPGNLGGKAYQTAEDISNEVKSRFVENKIILESNEDVADVQTPDFGDKKMRFMVTIRGTYRLIHIEDGSYLTISGVGQGMGVGVATASAVASTFSLKSALLRTFLISEAGVEQEGHTEQAAPKQNPAQQTAQRAAATPKAAAPKSNGSAENEAAKQKIQERIGSGQYDRTEVAAIHEKLAQERGVDKSEVIADLLKQLEAKEAK